MNWALLVCQIGVVLGWGADGHKVVAELAQALLDDLVREEVVGLLQSGLAAVATWADEVDHTSEFAWSKCMHYVDSADGVCAVDAQECGCCVLSAIHNYTSRAADRSALDSERVEAVKFLVHFYGDVHQPLHAGRKSDLGGNAIHVSVEFAEDLGESEIRENRSDQSTLRSSPNSAHTNLHSVWDSIILDQFLSESQLTYASYATELFGRIAEFPDFTTWVKSCVLSDCPLAAAEESAALACQMAYKTETGMEVVSGTALSRKYFRTRMQVVEARLAAGGVRLAASLNEIFSFQTPPTPPTPPDSKQLPELLKV